MLRYLDSSNAKLFDQAYVNRLNAYLPVSANTSENSNAFFADEVSELWMQSLIDPNVRLSFEQRLEVIQTAMMWLKVHKPNVQVTAEGKTMFDVLSASFEFAHPLWFIALPLPLLVYFAVPAYRTKQMAIKVPFFRELVEAIGEAPSEGASQLTPSWWQRTTLIITWILVVCALAKPTILGEPQVREQLGRDVMVVVDLSGSMAEQDFTSQQGDKISRLDATKEVLADFAKTRKGDRLGLILFGDAAFVQTPFTADQEVWLELLNQTDVAMAGQSTHLGDAIGLAIKVFEQSEKQSAVVQDSNVDTNEKRKS